MSGQIVDEVIAAFGGLTPMAKALGHKHITTIDSWRKAKRIPHWRRHEIAEGAAKANVRLPASFYDEPAANAAD